MNFPTYQVNFIGSKYGTEAPEPILGALGPVSKAPEASLEAPKVISEASEASLEIRKPS